MDELNWRHLLDHHIGRPPPEAGVDVGAMRGPRQDVRAFFSGHCPSEAAASSEVPFAGKPGQGDQSAGRLVGLPARCRTR